MSQPEIRISKEELAKLPAEKYVGEIVVISSPEEVDAAISELERAPLVGFDTETKPAFQKGQINQVALLQLATEQKCFLIRLCKVGLHPRVREFLENPAVTKVGLSIKDDFHSLAKLGSISPAGFIDLQELVPRFGIADASLTKIHAILFGRRISKSQQLSNWEAPSLSQRQQEYAALDARACISIYRHLVS